MKTGIIIPCYNEENRLNSNAFTNFINRNNRYHLCFVNDGSKDHTLEVLKKLQATNPHKISVINLVKNAGKAAAVRSGANYLYQRGDMNFIGFIDADLSTDFEDFENLTRTLKMNKNLSFVFGSRAKNATEGIQKDGLRAIFSKLINILIVLLLGLAITDTQCGAKVFRADLVPIIFDKNFFSRWLFDVEMFIKMKNHFGKTEIMNKILEQPLHRWVHMDDSKLGWKDAIEIPYRLLAIWLNYTILENFSSTRRMITMEPALEVYETPTIPLAA